MSQATFRSLFIGRPARVGLLLVVIVMWALAVVGPAAAQEDTPPSAPATLPAAPVGTPICGPTQNVGGAIATNTTWTAGKVYVLTGDITVNQLSTLTIQPGAVVKINWDRGFTVNGKLVANGTAEHPIYFTSIKDDSICGDTNGDSTGSVPNPGDWRWIEFLTTADSASSITSAVVRYGGRLDGYHYDNWAAPIRFRGAIPTLNNITFEDNYRNAAAIIGHNWLTSSLKPSNVIHILEDHIEILQANTFTIPAGLKMKPEWDKGIHVYGKLVAQGTANAPILFTSVHDDSVCGLGAAGEPICDTNNNTTASVPGVGDWRWIYFDGVSDPTSIISRAIIRYGGRLDGYYNDDFAAPIRFQSVVPTLDHLTFEHNYRNAASIMGGIWLTTALKSTTVIYVLESDITIPQANTFTIPAGVKIKPEWSRGIIVDGKLLIQGTDGQPVLFTSTADDTVCGTGVAGEPICDTNNNGVASVPAAGDWRWIDFTPVSDPASTITWAIFRYGGRRDEYYNDSWHSILRLNSTSPTVSYTAFRDNPGGIDVLGTAQPTLICNDFENSVDTEVRYAIYDETPATAVVARDNWWGSVSGPTHASNPHGAGDTVSDGIDFTPWRTTPCVLPPTAPDAAFEATPTSGEAPLSVSFFNTSGGAVTSSQWAFGDGGTSTAMNPTHVYTQPGVYSVTLTVNGPAGDDTVTNTAYIQVDATTYRMFAPVIVRPR